MILRVPEYYDEFSCIASRCKDSCCAGWEIDIDEESYAYYNQVEGTFGKRLKESMYEAAEEDDGGGYRFKLKGKKRCAMLNDNNLCDLYIALGEEALCEVCTEYPRFSLIYGNVEQKALSLSCEEVGRILFERQEPEKLIDIELPGNCDDGEDDPAYVDFFTWVQQEAVAILQNREHDITERMREFLAWCDRVQTVINYAQAKEDTSVLADWRYEEAGHELQEWEQNYREGKEQPKRAFSYQDFCDRFAIFEDMEELDEEWVHTKAEFAELFTKDTYEKILREYLEHTEGLQLGYEHLLVYFVYRYLMNAVYDFDILSYAKMIVVATLVVRDMDAARFVRNGGSYTLADRIDVARIFSKEVEHSEGNAEELKEMCMMEEIAKVDALYRQI